MIPRRFRRTESSRNAQGRPQALPGGSPVETLEPRLLFTAVPLITEFLASNDEGLQDEDGDNSDWIEVHNAGDTVLDLDGWFLTDDDDDLTQWMFPDVSIDPGQYLLVFASSKARADADGTELHTNFKLGSGGEYLALVEPDGLTVAHEYAPEYESQQEDVSYGLAMTINETVLLPEGSDAAYLVPTETPVDWFTTGFDDSGWDVGPTGIGYENSSGSTPNFTDLIATPVPSGTTTVYLRHTIDIPVPTQFNTLSLGVRYDDGFVAYLNGVRVAGDNDPASPTYLSTSTGSHVDVSAIEFDPFDITDHLGLLVAGENVLAIQVFNGSAGSSDFLIEAELTASFASVVTPHEIGFLAESTPGEANGQSFIGFVGDTSFSVDRGFFTESFDLEIATTSPTASIAYTLDGSAPAVTTAGVITNGMLYTGALTITGTQTVRAIGFEAGFEPTNVDTHTYIFAADVINQDAAYTLAQGFPPDWDGVIPDYGVNAAGVNPALFTSALTTIPTISLNLDVEELFGVNGIYTNSSSHGSTWEREASVEWINPDGSVGFQENAGLRIQGGAFRNHDLSKKHSFRLIFRGEYGAGRLDFPLFGADAADDYNTITLRMDSNDSWSWAGANDEAQYARDEFGRQTQRALGQPSSHGTRAHLYLNGVYWGIYNPVERPDANFAASYYGGDADDWDAINSGNATDGNLDAWDTLLALSQQVALALTEAERTAAYFQLQGQNADGTNNPLWENYLDTENYVDYLLTNFFSGNTDWPFKNYYMARERGIDSTGFKFHMWDSEWTLGLTSNLNTNRLDDIRGVVIPYGDLRSSEEFRLFFADRAHRALFNDGALTTANNVARYQAIVAGLDGVIEAEVGRWGDQHNPAGYTAADWQNETLRVINEFLNGRTQVFIDQLRAAGLYSAVDAVAWNQRGGPVADTFGIELAATEGTVYYTTDGSDPRMIGGAVSASAIEYTGAFTLTGHTSVRARVLHNGVWSAIDRADFVIAEVAADSTNLRVTELHYHPLDPTGAEEAAGFTESAQFEFIELMNVSGQTISLDGVEFKRTLVGAERNGVTFAFGMASLAPGERVVIVNDLAAFTERYGGGINVAGEFAGNLGNSGEQLLIVDRGGSTIQQFTYDDESSAGWASLPDGDGPSLVAIDTAGDYNAAGNWQSSVFDDGSPGAKEPVLGDITGDGFVGSADLDQVLMYWGDDAASSPEAAAADQSRDGTVNGADLSIVIANFGNGTPPATPTSNPGGDTADNPEPGADGAADGDAPPAGNGPNAGGDDGHVAPPDPGVPRPGDAAPGAPAGGDAGEHPPPVAPPADNPAPGVGGGPGENPPAPVPPAGQPDAGAPAPPAAPEHANPSRRPDPEAPAKPKPGKPAPEPGAIAPDTKPAQKQVATDKGGSDAASPTAATPALTPAQQRAAAMQKPADALALAMPVQPAATKQVLPVPARDTARRFDALGM